MATGVPPAAKQRTQVHGGTPVAFQTRIATERYVKQARTEGARYPLNGIGITLELSLPNS